LSNGGEGGIEKKAKSHNGTCELLAMFKVESASRQAQIIRTTKNLSQPQLMNKPTNTISQLITQP